MSEKFRDVVREGQYQLKRAGLQGDLKDAHAEIVRAARAWKACGEEYKTRHLDELADAITALEGFEAKREELK